MRFISLVLATVFLVGCSDPPKYEEKALGTTGITDHKTPVGGLGRKLCQFRVEIAGLTLGYAGSSTTLVQHNKCLTMKNGDRIVVKQRTRLSGKDDLPALRYFGKVGEVEFVLN